MPAEKQKILITFEDDFLKRIDDFRFENRIKSRSEAIRQLINLGLKAVESTNSNLSLDF
jgi:metal-responsive CopG/Arc/MetJ family transcriptional regulator